MGIRYEKDTILNWVNEMGKFLRLLVDKYEAFQEPIAPEVLEEGYKTFFQKERTWMHGLSDEALVEYIDQELEREQIRPLALLFMRDAFVSTVQEEKKKRLLSTAKMLINYASQQLGSFSFEDYGNLAVIDKELEK